MANVTIFPPDIIRLPTIIVLNTAAPLQEFKNSVSKAEFLLTDVDRIVELIIESLLYEKDSQYELAYRILDEIRGHIGDWYSNDLVAASNATVKFGNAILEQLLKYRLYHNGYLFYQFSSWLGNDLVLRRLG